MFAAALLRVRRPIILGAHLVLIPLVYFSAFALRFDLPLSAERVSLFWSTLPILLVLRLVAFGWFNLYEGWWRHAGMQDLIDIVRAITVSSVLFLCCLFLIGDVRALPRSLLVLDWLVALAVFCGLRFSVRTVREQRIWRPQAGRGKRTLIIGAGGAAESLLRQLRRTEKDRILPIALVDDDPFKRRLRMHGVRVEGTTEQIGELAERYRIELLILAMPSATPEEMRRVVERCVATRIEFKVVPTLNELMDGRARLGQLRSVDIEDLLGRSSVKLRLDLVELDLQGRNVVITGGAGSIGAELARQIARFQPARLIVVDKAESPLYFIDLEMRQAYPDLEVLPVIMDVTNPDRLEELFSTHRPSHVFHAAAYKHVPLMEVNVREAVRNNIIATCDLAECAARHGVEKFVLISTDKAVRPSSVMGASKRIAERIVLGLPHLRSSGTDFRAVRFGNVLGSDGSVVPLFKRQLAASKPLTVTHPEVTRYFMTIPEAVQLVLQAAVISEAAGRISMLEMGEPIRIITLAENLIRLSGLEPYRDVPIVFTGLRPGEKLHEELMSDVERTVATGIDKIRVVQTDEADTRALEFGVERLRVAMTHATDDDLLSAIRLLVPECVKPLARPQWTPPHLSPIASAADAGQAALGRRPSREDEAANGNTLRGRTSAGLPSRAGHQAPQQDHRAGARSRVAI